MSCLGLRTLFLDHVRLDESRLYAEERDFRVESGQRTCFQG